MLFWNSFFIALMAVFVFGCAHQPSPTVTATPSPTTAVVNVGPEDTDEEQSAETPAPEPSIKPKKTIAEIENLTIDEVIRIEEPNTQTLYDNSRYDFPITINSKVEGWMEYFTGRGRPHMERYLSRSSRYIPLMKEILKKAGMPEDLVYLALIESGFSMVALSRAKAVGPWQFMKPTGKRYGLRVDGWVDQRRDPIRSTEAAAKYLKDLYLMFESWYLAASAYNAGEYRILRAIESLKTNNYWYICQTHQFRRETKDYVPKLIAAAIIAKNPARYGFEEIEYLDPLQFETIRVDFPVYLSDLAKTLNTTTDELKQLNPELRRGMVPPDSAGYTLRIPVGSRLLAERSLSELKSQLIAGDLPQEYSVRSGETIKSIARKFHLNSVELARANDIGKRERLSPGTTLLIPSRRISARPEPRVTQSVPRAPVPEGGFIYHTVRRGDSLWSISERYDVTVQDLFRWNNLKKSKLFPGKKLKVKVSRDTSAA